MLRVWSWNTAARVPAVRNVQIPITAVAVAEMLKTHRIDRTVAGRWTTKSATRTAMANIWRRVPS